MLALDAEFLGEFDTVLSELRNVNRDQEDQSQDYQTK